MQEQENTGLDFEIDELTNSIRNIISNDSFQTTISRITKSDLKTVTKKKDGYSISDKNLASLKEMYSN